MGQTGDKIDYSLRLQKNVERKILGDIIRTLDFFGSIDKYRYIGFGSFYFKDFILLHEKFNIQSGISIEQDKRFYAQKDTIIRRHTDYLDIVLGRFSSEMEKWRIDTLQVRNVKLNKEDVERILSIKSQEIYEWFWARVCDAKAGISDMNVIKTPKYDFYDLEKDLEGEAERICGNIKLYLSDFFRIETTGSCDNVDHLVKAMPMPSEELFVPDEYIEYIKEGFTNRYKYNKPFGFIKIIQDELIDAYNLISWSPDIRNIFWLDYDKFINDSQLSGLEKSIKNANHGDLIIFSTSMGTSDVCRCDSLNALREESGRIADEVLLKNCNDKGIPFIIRKIVCDVIKSAMSYKNTTRPENTSEFVFQPIVELTYADGMPMYTYGGVICNTEDDCTVSDFPASRLVNQKWYPKEDSIFRIYVPAITHKELNAINQMLPQKSASEIAEEFPYIERKNIEKYIEIWRYYPNYLEVDGYV